MGAESFNANMEKGLIEVAPLAYMRGRTLDNAFIILDEAQNTTPAQMKMFLTRIGFGSKVVVTGDQTQKDLPRDVTSGLDVAMKVLSKVDEIGFVKLTNHDVVRHPLVQKIVKAYEEYENRQNKKEFDRRNRKESDGRSKKNYDSRQGKKRKEQERMTINIEYETDKKLDLDYEKIINEVVNEAAAYEKCPYEIEVNVTLTDNEAIHQINKEFREVDAPTDVLSFPMINYEAPSDFESLEDEFENNTEDYFNPDTGELMLGDIVVSVEKVAEQAEKYGHSEVRELAFLVAHSMMHLLDMTI